MGKDDLEERSKNEEFLEERNLFGGPPKIPDKSGTSKEIYHILCSGLKVAWDYFKELRERLPYLIKGK